MANLLVNNIGYLVTCDDDDRILKNVNVSVRDGVIDYIGNEERAADEVIDGTDMVMYPGLINTHHHLYQTFSRNLPEVQNMELFPWLKYLYEIWKNLDEKVVYY
ncbi:MAG: 8-oxoguanine deaminase, partial [Lachnospiraceae bacterium]|nr:8-oxoguanine deaminase [Lachnospiraceae bacterium]